MKKIYAILMVFFFLMAGTAFAVPFNTRPLGPSDANLVTTTTGEASLSTIFGDIGFNAGAYDPYGTQSNAAIFTNMASGGAVASFIIAIAGNAPENTVGMYQYGDTDYLLPIFDGIQGDATQATVSFFADNSVKVTSTGTGGTIIEQTYTNFGNVFGFYLSGPGGTFFTLDSDNPNNASQALIYQGNGIDEVTVPGFHGGLFGTNHWIVAFEDLPYNTSDKDFNDFVFIVESIQAVPEPSTMLFLGTSLLGLLVVSRRKIFKK